jgi:pyruvate dehydrogenase E2 component (dihydrolipoamide acetyltransferase)
MAEEAGDRAEEAGDRAEEAGDRAEEAGDRAEEVRDFLVPDLGEGLEEATVVEWKVAPGEPVALNQVLCSVETAKAEVEVPSPYAGRVVALGGAAGETLAVGSLLARIALEAGGPPPAVTAGPEPTLVGYGHDESIDRSRRRRTGAVRTGAGTGPGPAVGRTTVGAPAPPRPVPPAPAAAGMPPGAVPSPGRPLAAPPVRKLARDLGVDLAALAPGSGPDGVVTRADVQAAAAPPGAPTDRATPTGTDPGARAAITVVPVTGARAAITVVPVTGVRARVAEHMSRSRARIPDATCQVTVDCTRLLEVRTALDGVAERRGLGRPVTPFALLCRLFVQALRDAPTLNASYDEAGPSIRVSDPVHLGIGTATERGLLVTVVHDADRRSTLDLATEIARLATRARDGAVTPAELTGSTVTVSNFGALGLDEGIPVINHPEAAVLGVGSIRPRPHVVGGEVVARPTAALTLAFDHRVADGAEAGRLLGTLRDLVESPELALLDA